MFAFPRGNQRGIHFANIRCKSSENTSQRSSERSKAAARRMLKQRHAGKTAITLMLDGEENEPPRFYSVGRE